MPYKVFIEVKGMLGNLIKFTTNLMNTNILILQPHLWPATQLLSETSVNESATVLMILLKFCFALETCKCCKCDDWLLHFFHHFPKYEQLLKEHLMQSYTKKKLFNEEDEWGICF